MKKQVYAASVAALALLMAACSSGNQASEAVLEPDKVITTVTTEPVVEPVVASMTALEVSRLMGNGINLGNTMEAYGYTTLGTTAEISEYETLWGAPVTTKTMVDGMKNAGFDTLRLPVAWTNGMNFEEGDYTIRADLLDRVEEIVNYALDNDMYVIINDHWDGGWWGMFGSATAVTRDMAMEMYTSMWTQIGQRFQDYSDHVILESANEELGDRLNDKDFAPDSGSLSEDERYAAVNEINQQFVDTIRGLGGNNETRFLLIAGYNTDIAHTVDDRYVMPTDTVPDKLLVSVHYYDPWSYTGTSSVTRWGRTQDLIDQNTTLEKMTKFTDAGYGVVIGEFAVLIEDGIIKDNMNDFYINFLDNCDLYGFVPVLWDTNSLFNRAEGQIILDDVAATFKARSASAQAGMSEAEIQANAAANIAATLANAPEKFDDSTVVNADGAQAWIMFASSDWSIMYSAGDDYDPESKTDGLVVTDAEITGPGTYTVGIDFTGTASGYADGIAFSAIGISNGEDLYPGYKIDITGIEVNGQSYEMNGQPYTASDNGSTTRTNLLNDWVDGIPGDARFVTDDGTGATASILSNDDLGHIESLFITFEYLP